MKKFLVTILFLMMLTSYIVSNSKIAYCSKSGGSSEQIWIMSLDGTGKTQLTNNNNYRNQGPQFSPNGKEIIYQRWNTNEFELVRMNIDGTGKHVIKTYNDYFYLYDWTKSNKLIITGNSPGCFSDDIRILNPDGSGEYIFVYYPSHGATECLSGNEVIYVKSFRCSTPRNEIHIINLDGTNDRMFQSNDGKAEFQVSYANTQDKFAYHQSDAGSGNPNNIYIMNKDGSGKTKITFNTGNVGYFSPGFSYDDSQIVFQRNKNSQRDIGIMNSDGSNIRILTESNTLDYNVDISLQLCMYAPEDQPLIFTRKKGKPEAELFEWDSCGGLGKIIISNNKVSSAYILLNGEQIFEPSDFNQKDEDLKLEIELLKGINILSVDLKGKPGEKLEISFEETK